MKPNTIQLKPKILLTFFLFLLIGINLTLYFLRVHNSEWWTGDTQAYKDVKFNIHTSAILFYIFYILCYFIIVRLVFLQKTNILKKKNLPNLFYLLIILFTTQILFAILYGTAVASSTNRTSSSFEYLVLVVSFDAMYYAYALKEKNNTRLVIASFFYCISNIVRGWAGFIVFLLFIHAIRMRKIEIKKIIFSVIVFLLATPLLLLSREFFRNDNINLSLLLNFNLLSFDFFFDFIIESFKSILVRFDFYSNYIGIDMMRGIATGKYVCIPIQENIFLKLLGTIKLSGNCTSLGSILPGFLYSFFSDKGTSFTISSGFFALPPLQFSIYFFSYIFILLTTSIFVKTFMKADEYKCFFIVLVFILLLQGWMYNFLQAIIGFSLGWFLSGEKFQKKIVLK